MFDEHMLVVPSPPHQLVMGRFDPFEDLADV